MRHVLILLLTAAAVLSVHADSNECRPGVLEPQRLLATSLGQPSYIFGDLTADGESDLIITDGFRMTALVNRGGAFEQLPTIGTSAYYFAVDAIYDQNGDGLADLVAQQGWMTEVRLGRGDGTFADPIASPVIFGKSPRAHRLFDFDGDGVLDAFIVLDDAIAFSSGNADGTFDEAVQVPLSTPVHGDPLIGDFNGDGLYDVFYFRQITSEQAAVTLVHVDRDHRIREVQQTVNAAIERTSVIDMNGDRHDEILIARENQFALIEWSSAGAISVTPRSWPGVPDASKVGFVRAGDVTGDGRPDLLIAVYSGWLLLRAEDNGFSPPLPLGIHGQVQFFDVTRDGINDLVAGDATGVSFIAGGPDIESRVPRLQLTRSSGWTLRAADMNHDGVNDLVVLSPSAVEVLTRNPAGDFRTSIFYPLLQTDEPVDSRSTPILDWNGDGYLDLAVTTRDQGPHILLGTGTSFSTGPRLPVARIVGSGTVNGREALFGVNGSSVYSVTPSGGSATSALVTNLEPGMEAAAVVGAPGEPAELLFSGAGPFQYILRNAGSAWQRIDLPPLGAGPFRATAGNLDGEGIRDLFLYSDHGAAVLLADASGQYRHATIFTAHGDELSYLPGAATAAIVDFDGDGLNDIARFGDSGTVFRNLGGGSFEPMFEMQTKPFDRGAVVGNFDGNGRPDVVLLGEEAVRIHPNGCAASLGRVGATVRTQNDVATATLTINAFPAGYSAGVVIALDGNVVHQATLGGSFYSTTWTSDALQPGTHTFDVTLETPMGGRSSTRKTVYVGDRGRRRAVRH